MEKKRYRYALFLSELAVEKTLKGLVVKTTDQEPPKIHDLLRLADITRISLTQERKLFLARVQKYCLEGRYPDYFSSEIPYNEAKTVLDECREIVRWLTNLFN